MPVTLLIGGARSGKSFLAVELASASDAPVTFFATAPLDVGMSERIERHRAQRPVTWSTREVPVELVAALEEVAPEATVIVDCLTLWVSNLMLDGRDDDVIEKDAAALAAAAEARSGVTVVVTNEVGSGVHPPTALGMRFQDLLGRVNTIVAARADRAFLCVAGRALPLGTAEDALR